ncbi:serine/threonine-protein kinase Nek10 isoform X2 [Nelusetta ayraudi]|uniref:serine/threonine-protein kinase Nek10 isoform X2 n=1 Tax=Nelusetta ayraudi TaxID=303726 RepID=UPI003F722262
MFSVDKEGKQREMSSLKSNASKSKASHDLRRLRGLLGRSSSSSSSSKPEAAALSRPSAAGSRSQGPRPPREAIRPGTGGTSEDSELEKFSITYKDQRCFSSHPLHALFSDILVSLIRNRLCSDWLDNAPPESVLRVLICLRLLIRDPQHQAILHQLQGINSLAKHMESVADSYLLSDRQEFAVQQLVTMTYVFQKLSAAEEQRGWVIETGAHKALVTLLSSTDSSVLLGALLALTSLAESPECGQKIGDLPIVENLLVILQEHDLLSKRMSVELLRLLSPVQQVRDQLRELEGLPVLLSLLLDDQTKLLWSVAWVLVQLCQEPEARAEIRAWGGVQQLLWLLHSDRQYVRDGLSTETPASAQQEHLRDELSLQEEAADNKLALQSACCAVLTELSLDDASAHHIVQENGVYVIAKLILAGHSGPKVASLQCYAFRTLRFLFSVERNRHLFKRLFPTDLFEMFIDVGHYVRDIAAYQGLQAAVSLYTEDELRRLREAVEAADQNRPPLRAIHGYSILDHLGSGAFGSVFKVRKQSGQNLLALKEVNLHNPAFGKDKRSRDCTVEEILSELSIVKEQARSGDAGSKLKHPNVVKYYKTFLEGDRLYVVMELIEGEPLAEHLASLREKQQRFTEERIWNIFIQMCLALRYLHKEKRIVHRDLTPSNIMLGEEDKVTITDFGLAKQKQENSKLTSVVGTILYSCPEVVKNEPYGEKADIWALGCILYQMAALQPPFCSSNMLSLASKVKQGHTHQVTQPHVGVGHLKKKNKPFALLLCRQIVEGVYEPLGAGLFSERIPDMIRWCLSPDADLRPDIVAVGAKISDLMMLLMDGLCARHRSLERRADRDRKRAQRYFLEWHRGGTSCPPQEKLFVKTAGGIFSKSDSSFQRCERPCAGDASNGDVELSEPAAVTGNHRGLRSGGGGGGGVTPDQTASRVEPKAAKVKVRPVSAGICVSHRKLRQIDDPVHRLLAQLHKIIHVTQVQRQRYDDNHVKGPSFSHLLTPPALPNPQLPPAPHRDLRWRLVERFKRSLFQRGSQPSGLKEALCKLLRASPELMEFGSTPSDWFQLVHQLTGDPFTLAANSCCSDTANGEASLKDGITYQQMQVDGDKEVIVVSSVNPVEGC